MEWRPLLLRRPVRGRGAGDPLLFLAARGRAAGPAPAQRGAGTGSSFDLAHGGGGRAGGRAGRRALIKSWEERGRQTERAWRFLAVVVCVSRVGGRCCAQRHGMKVQVVCVRVRVGREVPIARDTFDRRTQTRARGRRKNHAFDQGSPRQRPKNAHSFSAKARALPPPGQLEWLSTSTVQILTIQEARAQSRLHGFISKNCRRPLAILSPPVRAWSGAFFVIRRSIDRSSKERNDRV